MWDGNRLHHRKVVEVMETQEIINAISSVGFPIVSSGALFWMINKTMAELTDAINNLTAYLKSERGEKSDETH